MPLASTYATGIFAPCSRRKARLSVVITETQKRPAIQDDVTMVGSLRIISGTNGAPGALLGGIAEVGLEPQHTKIQALGTTEEALADKPEWLPVPSVVIDPTNGESFRAFGMKVCGAPIGKLDSGEAQVNHRYYDKSDYSHPIS